MSFREISETWPKARKEYQCVWCGEKILIGEIHCYRAYTMEGQFQRDRMHKECQSDMVKACTEEPGFSWSPGEFQRPSPAPKDSHEEVD